MSDRGIKAQVIHGIGVSLVVALLASGLALWPAWAWAGQQGLAALAIAAAISWAGAVAGQLSAALLRNLLPGPGGALQAIQAAMAVRLLITLVGATPILLLELVPSLPFTAWMALHYLAQLALEVFVSVKIAGQNPGPSAGSSGSAGESLAVQGRAAPPTADTRPTERD